MEDAAEEISAVIREKMKNGEWLVEILEDGGFDALYVYNAPVIEESYNNKFKAESNFFVGEGEIARAHQVYAGDMVAISPEGFVGTPVEGAIISAISDKKLVVSNTSI